MTKICRAVLICFFVAVTLFSSDTEAADSFASSWLKSEEPTISKKLSSIDIDSLPTYSNKECLANTKFVTIPKNILTLQTESSYSTCSTQTAFGTQGVSDGQIRLHDTGVAGNVKNALGSNLILNAIPGSRHIMYQSGGLYGSYRFIVKNFQQNSASKVEANGSLSFQLKPDTWGSVIKDSDGHSLEFTDTRFSDNGQWMVGDVPFVGMARVNIETGQTLIFGDPYNHAGGIRPHFVSAVSNDGRYVFNAESNYGTVKIYDLATCSSNSVQHVSCEYKDLLTYLQSKISDFSNISHIQFSTSYSVRLYVNRTDSQTDLYLLTAFGEQESSLDYLALGDSFASGEGTFNYKPGTDTKLPLNKCHLSLISYPYLLSTRSQLGSTQSVACSGAKMKDIYFSDIEKYNSFESQSKGKEELSFDTSIYSNYLVGYRPQANYVERDKPSHLTISISGNDFGFGKILLRCVQPGTCYENSIELANLVYTINDKYDAIVAAYQQIKDLAATNAAIFVIGYPSLTDAEGNCALNVHFDKRERLFANQLVDYINDVLRKAADKTGLAYVDTTNALLGHRLCETKSSDIAINGLTEGDEKTFSFSSRLLEHPIDINLLGRESYHPNQLGHELLAGAIFSSTNGLSRLGQKVPAEVPQLTGPASASFNPRKIIFDDRIINSFLLLGTSNEIHLSNLLPVSSLDIFFDSGLAKLGSFTTNSSGEFQSSTTLPASTTPGFHVLHVYAKNVAGENIDIQSEIYVAVSQEDIDGDNILNIDEKCLTVEASNIDDDQDAIDDSCDAFIADPPLRVAPILSLSKNSSQVVLLASHTDTPGSNIKMLRQTKPQILGLSNNIISGKETSATTATKRSPHSYVRLSVFSVLLLIICITSTCLLLGRRWRKRL